MICPVAPELIVIGADTTLANAVGRAERSGLASTFARPSTLAVIAKTYVFPASSVGNVTEVFAVRNRPAGRYPGLPSGRVVNANGTTW